MVATSPRALTAPAGFSEVVVFATNSVHFSKNAQIAGDVVVNDASPGPTLVSGFELAVDRDSSITGNVKADSVKLDRNVAVGGTVSYNDLTSGTGVTTGGLDTPLPLPVFATPPTFEPADVRPDAEDVFVAAGQTVTLTAGSYRDVTIAQHGTLVFAGGIFDVGSIAEVTTAGGQCAAPCRSIAFSAATSLRIEGRLSTGKNAYVGPLTGSGVFPRDVVVYVGGTNGGAGTPAATPAAAHLGQSTTVAVNLYVANGTLDLDKVASATGAFLGRDVSLDQSGLVSLDSAFSNQPPTADPQTVETNGANALVITLTGSDPEGDDLTFSIVPGSGPTEGTLDPVVEDPEPFPGNPPGCNPANTDPCDPPEPPRTSATVTYHPATAANLEDSFQFQVMDPIGNVGMATVTINPPPEGTEPPDPVDTVVAVAQEIEVYQNTPKTIVLSGNAPEGVDLTFALVAGTGPDHGDAGALTAGSETPVRTASLTYTPDEGYVGDDSFDFQVCGTVESVEVCDTATVTISVAVPQASAFPQTLETPENTPVTITLTGAPGLPDGETPTGGGLRVVLGQVQVVTGATVAGSVADSNGDNMGDNHNNLPGNSPILAFAGVDQTGGAGFNGVVRYEVEWDLSGQTTTIESADVVVTWNRGTVDTLDTFFFAGTGDQDGLLTDTDFEAPVAQISGATLPVPTNPVGTTGTFTFDVTSQLASALDAGFGYFSVKGRVDESLAGTGAQRGVQIFTSANPSAALAPRLEVESSALVFKIVSLPANGALTAFDGGAIDEVPTTLTVNRLTYSPGEGFRGIDSFLFEVDDPVTGTSATAQITIYVQFIVPGDCEADPASCDDGRP